MNRNSLSVFLVLALAFLLSSITVSAQQPRAVPPNDDFNNAQAIKIGKSYTVPDIDAATNEIGEPTASCKFGAVIQNSVWFTFKLPTNSEISISTFGSLLMYPQGYNMNTVLTVYELTGPGVFTERACIDDANLVETARLVFSASADATYYIGAGTTGAGPYLPESTLKLTTRMITTTIRPHNRSFETPITVADWKLKNGSDDQVECSSATYPAVNDNCTFRFIGTPGITTKLTQTLAFPTTFLPRKNAFLTNIFYFRVMNTASLGTTKVRFIVSYSDGTPPNIQVINLTGTAPSGAYESRWFSQVLKSGKVASIKFEVKFGASAGILLIDYINFFYVGDPGTRTRGLLPVPQAPAAQ